MSQRASRPCGPRPPEVQVGESQSHRGSGSVIAPPPSPRAPKAPVMGVAAGPAENLGILGTPSGFWCCDLGAGEPHAKSKQEHIGGGHPLRSFCFCLLFFWF